MTQKEKRWKDKKSRSKEQPAAHTQEDCLGLTPEEYEALAIMVYAGDWIINSYEVPKNRKKIYTEVKKKVFSQADKFGKGNMIIHLPKYDLYQLKNEYGEEGIAMKFIEAYENAVFWDELINHLAKRDILHEYGREVLEEMEPAERIRLLMEKEEEYGKIFEEHGLDCNIVNRSP